MFWIPRLRWSIFLACYIPMMVTVKTFIDGLLFLFPESIFLSSSDDHITVYFPQLLTTAIQQFSKDEISVNLKT